MKKLILTLPALAMVACTSTHVEDMESANYEPVYLAEPVEQSYGMPSGAIYGGGQMGLFAMDRRATQVGDILTVELSEKFAATKAQAASSSKNDAYTVDLPNFLPGGILDGDLSSSTTQNFAGNGQASQSNSLTGRMSVSVVRILPGGNLEILGQKKLTLNNGDEYIRLRGIVRPADISSDNVVRSDRVANAEIKYIGAGQIADTSKKGWLRQAVDAVSPY